MKFWNKPYPAENGIKGTLINAAGISVFLFAFMFIFGPFGISNAHPSEKFWSVSLFAVINFICILIFYLISQSLFPHFFREEKWTVGKEIISIASILILITFVCTIVSVFYFGSSFSFGGFFILTGKIFSIALLPVGFSILTKYNTMLKRNLKAAEKMSQSLHEIVPERNENEVHLVNESPLIVFKQERGGNNFKVPLDKFIYAESEGNYLLVHYLENNLVQSQKVRTTIKQMEEEYSEFNNLFRSHRAYWVNMNFVENVNGNSRGYTLFIKDIQQEIPVSRKYIPLLKSFLNIPK